MKRILLCVLSLLLLASCGKSHGQQGPGTTAGETIGVPPDETVLDVPAQIETATEHAAKELSCEAFKKDGAVYKFEMRFRRTNAIDAMMADPDNFYFGVLQCGKKRIVVPTEEIRVLLDVPTDSFVVTLLVPQNEKLRDSSTTVSFYISAREDGAGKSLFTAQQTVDIS